MTRLVRVLVYLFVFVVPVISVAQSQEPQFKGCKKAWKAVKASWSNDVELLRESREYLTHCSSETDPPQRVRLLGRMGHALIQTGQFQESIPLFKECESTSVHYGLQGDLADCWNGLGEAAARQGLCRAAQVAFKAASDVPTTDNLASVNHEMAKFWLNTLQGSEASGAFWLPPLDGVKCCSVAMKCIEGVSKATEERKNSSTTHFYGSGFFISNDGYVLTNNHVIKDCTSVIVSGHTDAQIVSRDPKDDLALLKIPTNTPHFAIFRRGDPIKIGDSVVVFGFPLPGTLSSTGAVTSGIISSLFGFHGDPRTMQFSAPVQPGNSGGPLLDRSAHVIGVVEAKLRADVDQNDGIIPENVSFAIQWATIEAFLQNEGVKPERESSDTPRTSSEIAATAQQITVPIDCSQ